MSKIIRKCGENTPFNTGVSKCPVKPEYIKAIIAVMHGHKLPATLSKEEIEKACHADMPARIYPLVNIVEYAPSGGEAQVSNTGYGPSSITGYSDTADVFTFDDSDVQRRASILANMNTQFDIYYVDDNNVVWGVEDAEAGDGEFPLKGFCCTLGLGGQPFRSSGSQAQDTVTVYIKDWKQQAQKMASVNATINLKQVLEESGLRFVEFVAVEANKYQLVDKNASNLDITPWYGKLIADNAEKCIVSSHTAVSYQDGLLNITGEAPVLAKPSVLQEAGVIGIEQA